ncbi:MAG: Exodeoxyribonuclease VII small subunit [Ignavibacteriae bacterium]|nr:MAG: Exodeoxyribonuclease VII small subunit [Ignavibacteriota bacterium]
MKKKSKDSIFTIENQKDLKSLKFEDCFKRLEKIVSILEEGSVSLEESIKLYEEGIGLAKICMEKLSDAELKIKKLSKEINGKIIFEDFDLDE